jgi:hypothetical protein
MTFSREEFDGREKQPRVAGRNRFLYALDRLDAVIAAIVRAAWRAILDDLAAAGMAHCASIVDLHPSRSAESERQGDAVSMSDPVSRVTYFDDISGSAHCDDDRSLRRFIESDAATRSERVPAGERR